MFRLAWFGLGFATTHILLDSWTRLVELAQIGEEAQATADDTASLSDDTASLSTIAYDGFETDGTGYATTNSSSESDEDDAQQSDEESDEDVENDPAPP